jgi:hypothetical protein
LPWTWSARHEPRDEIKPPRRYTRHAGEVHDPEALLQSPKSASFVTTSPACATKQVRTANGFGGSATNCACRHKLVGARSSRNGRKRHDDGVDMASSLSVRCFPVQQLWTCPSPKKHQILTKSSRLPYPWTVSYHVRSLPVPLLRVLRRSWQGPQRNGIQYSTTRTSRDAGDSPMPPESTPPVTLAPEYAFVVQFRAGTQTAGGAGWGTGGACGVMTGQNLPVPGGAPGPHGTGAARA